MDRVKGSVSLFTFLLRLSFFSILYTEIQEGTLYSGSQGGFR